MGHSRIVASGGVRRGRTDPTAGLVGRRLEGGPRLESFRSPAAVGPRPPLA
ncbi:hypothetical protein STVIR_1521 [Streptomyces viridochromogenes Tue57]|uniref:Uncharacterized protein n=1 Tax=Streptomyces viridochromogenes Tue57 TaxID=1160705 RepID=L8PQ28_STRVR|nr:hypothetical protein STVIR_1521 [Streptomyces viridochromogenes Tue57]